MVHRPIVGYGLRTSGCGPGHRPPSSPYTTNLLFQQGVSVKTQKRDVYLDRAAEAPVGSQLGDRGGRSDVQS